MKYYSVMKKKEILPLVTPWMDLEGIMLSETNTVRSPLNVESKKKKERKKERKKSKRRVLVQMVVAKAGGWVDEMVKGAQRYTLRVIR